MMDCLEMKDAVFVNKKNTLALTNFALKYAD